MASPAALAAFTPKKIRTAAKTLAQHVFITVGFFGKNGLTNHAAAGAYGFLLSAAPMLLIATFFLIRAFRTAPEAAMSLLSEIPLLDVAAGDQWPALEFLIYAPAGAPTLVFMLSVLWAGRIFAVSMQRGIKIVCAGSRKRNPVTEKLVTLAIELSVLAVMLAVILGSRMALRLYDAAGFFTGMPRFVGSLLGAGPFRLAALGFLLYFAYRLIPANPPRRLAALWGSALCVAAYGIAASIMSVMLRLPRYNFLYGALGDIVVALVGVYFFFLCFFLGCQFAAVASSFEAHLFLRIRETRVAAQKGRGLGPILERALFYEADGMLEKYRKSYAEGETIILKGDMEKDVYFILEGEADVLLPSRSGDGCVADRQAGTLKAGSFIGEMGYLLSEGRTATIRAGTCVSALKLPPGLFGEILGNDTELDKSIIENLSRRIKRGNEQLAALGDENARGAE